MQYTIEQIFAGQAPIRLLSSLGEIKRIGHLASEMGESRV